MTSTSVVTFPVRYSTDNDKSNEDRQKEEELLLQIQKLVETRDFLVDDVEFERLRCICVFVFGLVRVRVRTSCLCSLFTTQLESGLFGGHHCWLNMNN